MGDSTGIEWCDATFNPWWGCWPVSPGCAFCYAARDAERYGWREGGASGPNLWEKTGLRRRFGEEHWSGKNSPFRWANTLPAKLGRRPRIFCASMADIGEDHPVADQERPKLWTLIEATPELDWLLLTKRVTTARQWLPERWLASGAWPQNVWFGFSAEDQQRFDERWAAAALVPAPIRFCSYEPALGPIDFRFPGVFKRARPAGWDDIGEARREFMARQETLSWVIAGGESGPKARPSRPGWFRSARDQAVAAGVPFLFKQWGENAPPLQVPGLQGIPWPVDPEAPHRVGKRAAGRLLDGRTWDEFPGGAR